MPGVVLAVIVALIVSSYLKRRKKKEQARLSPADERKLSARPEPGGPVLTDPELDEMEQLLRKLRPEQETSDAAPAHAAPDETLARRVVDYYTGMWNGTDGTLFTDPAMTIDRFGFRLEGSTQPLISDTAYSALPGQSRTMRLEDGQCAPLYARVKDALLQLGTVRCRNELFYPIHTAPEHDSKADLEAQMQQLLKAKKETAAG